VGALPKSNLKNDRNRGKIYTLTHMYVTAHSLGWIQAG
jgi:hypothetical protein